MSADERGGCAGVARGLRGGCADERGRARMSADAHIFNFLKRFDWFRMDFDIFDEILVI